MSTALDDFSDIKPLHRGARRDVLSAIRREDRLPVVLKVFTGGQGSYESAKRELEALRACAHANVPRALELSIRDEDPCLVLERVAGHSLWSWIGSAGPAPVEAVLEIAVAVAEALAQVHAARYIHRDVAPRNIVFDSESGRAYLIDFGLAVPIGSDSMGVGRSGSGSELSGTLLFVAPEQTGRMNRSCGFQTDLYSLGATLYFAATGQPPFPFQDPLELIHAHIARAPRAPIELRPDLPTPISDLLLKLLAKEPDERYSTARSLLGDLRALLQQLRESGSIDPGFRLGLHEVPDSPRIPAQLFGREREVAALERALEYSCAEGPRVVWLRGASGIGVSALVDSLRSRLTERGGYFLASTAATGQMQAYAWWTACIDAFVQQILVEDEERLGIWRDTLASALGGVADALCERVPDLSLIVGEAPVSRSLGVNEARARVLLAMQRLLVAASSAEQPLVLFLDEFQLADSGSRFVLEELFTAERAGAYLIVVAERSGDSVEADTSMEAVRDRIASLSVPIDSLTLAPIDDAALAQLLEAALGRSAADVVPLVGPIARKTAGNPLAVRQLLEHLARRDLLTFVPERGWTWDASAIADAEVPDGASALLVARLDQLEPHQRDLLSSASCAGSSFSPELLAQLVGGDASETRLRLHALEEQGLVVACPQGFRFAHSRIREAAARGLDDAERRGLHARIATITLDAGSEAPSDDALLELAEHLIRAADRWPIERCWTRVEICVDAGRRSLRAGAVQEARARLEFACSELEAQDVSAHRELALRTWLAGAEGAFLERDADRSLELLELAEPHVVSELEYARLEMQRIQALNLVRSADACLAHALQVLRRWGIRWPAHPTKWQVRWAMFRVRRRVRERARLGTDAPGGTLEGARAAALMIINAAGGVMSRVDCRLAALATCYVLRQPLPTALGTREAYSIGNYALWCLAVLHQAPLAQELAGLSEAWIRRAGDAYFAERLAITRSGSLNGFVMRRQRALAPLERTEELAQENGDVEFAYYARFLRTVYSVLGGAPVRDSYTALSDLGEMVERARYRFTEPARCIRGYRWLFDPSLDPESIQGEVPTSRRDGPEAGPRSPDVWSTTLWTMVLCVFGRWQELWDASEDLGIELYRQAPYAHVADHLLYRGIAASALASSQRHPRVYRRGLTDSSRRLQRWSRLGPDFAHMALLLRAESARLARRLELAERLYQQAARQAMTQEFPHHAAIAMERRAAMLTDHRRHVEATRAIGEALRLYGVWGAEPKVARLRARGPG